MIQRMWLAAAVIAFGALASCSLPLRRVGACSVEQHTRVLLDEDAMEWIAIEHGLCVGSDGGEDQLRELLSGKPYLPGAGFMIDLSDPELREQMKDESPESRVALEYFAGLQVLEARLVLDEHGDPTLWRRMKTGPVLELINSRMAPVDFPVSGMPELDAASVESLERAKDEGRRIWTLTPDGLVFEGPVSAAFAERCRVDWKSDGAPEPSFDGTTLKLEFPNRNGGSPWSTEIVGRAAWNASTAETLRFLESHGFQVQSAETYAQLRAAAGLP